MRDNALPKAVTGRLAWSIEEVAEQMGVSKGHLRKEIKVGKLQAKRVGRRILVLDGEVRRYLEELPDYTGDGDEEIT